MIRVFEIKSLDRDWAEVFLGERANYDGQPPIKVMVANPGAPLVANRTSLISTGDEPLDLEEVQDCIRLAEAAAQSAWAINNKEAENYVG
jgi:hypothetical protein